MGLQPSLVVGADLVDLRLGERLAGLVDRRADFGVEGGAHEGDGVRHLRLCLAEAHPDVPRVLVDHEHGVEVPLGGAVEGLHVDVDLAWRARSVAELAGVRGVLDVSRGAVRAGGVVHGREVGRRVFAGVHEALDEAAPTVEPTVHELAGLTCGEACDVCRRSGRVEADQRALRAAGGGRRRRRLTTCVAGETARSGGAHERHGEQFAPWHEGDDIPAGGRGETEVAVVLEACGDALLFPDLVDGEEGVLERRHASHIRKVELHD